MVHQIYQRFLQKLEESFPQAFLFLKENSVQIKPELISPFVLDLSQTVIDEASDFISHAFSAFASPDYTNKIIEDFPLSGAPTNYSALTCFDFHYSPEMGLKLIEINTNASLYLTTQVLRKAHGLPMPFAGDESLLNEFKTSYASLFSQPIADVIIFDRDPKHEGLFFEFLLYKEWFARQGWVAKIMNLQELNECDLQKKLIYNRYTDFYLNDIESIKIKEAYNEGIACITPNPWGYYSMADKSRLQMLREFLPDNLKSVVPETRKFSEYSSFEDVWQKRKGLFFKPSSSFGSKAVYSGRGISRKMFDKISSPDFIAQELAPAGKVRLQYEATETEMKYDLRFFANPAGIVEGVARLYQGQTTNMNTPLGGIAPLRPH